MPPNTDRDRQRGVTVRVLDMTTVYEEIATALQNNGETKITEVDTPWRWGLATTPAGVHHLLCDEGVDFGPINDETHIPFEVWDRSDPGMLAMIPVVAVKLHLADVKDLPSTDEDLADFVRRFGSRLERNFHLLHDIYTGSE